MIVFLSGFNIRKISAPSETYYCNDSCESCNQLRLLIGLDWKESEAKPGQKKLSRIVWYVFLVSSHNYFRLNFAFFPYLSLFFLSVNLFKFLPWYYLYSRKLSQIQLENRVGNVYPHTRVGSFKVARVARNLWVFYILIYSHGFRFLDCISKLIFSSLRQVFVAQSKSGAVENIRPATTKIFLMCNNFCLCVLLF